MMLVAECVYVLVVGFDMHNRSVIGRWIANTSEARPPSTRIYIGFVVDGESQPEFRSSISRDLVSKYALVHAQIVPNWCFSKEGMGVL